MGKILQPGPKLSAYQPVGARFSGLFFYPEFKVEKPVL
jgi:hypothetical protein